MKPPRVSGRFEGSLAISVLPFQNADADVGAGAGMRMDRAALGVLHLQRLIAEMFLHGALQLPEGEDALHQAGRADGMPASDQAARRIDGALGFLRQLMPII